VLLAFGPPQPLGCECCHTNGNMFDNRISNLRWGTSLENNSDKARHGRPHSGERNRNARLTDEGVRAIRRRSVDELPGALAREFGVCYATIWCIVTNRTWRHLLNDASTQSNGAF